ncbi:MAG TPA: hypothetical protein IAB26_09060 [Candidatus Limivivens merdigallinarum]|uniref:Alpha-L-rhamnosidase six-hairpin glycosidase domain-containing protein n=1 Tax=Candidatus Limivivens merdigallinarum TaxID=2840859 RepID=A0A9D0ZW61_9FIRM|nr:hypothetical protein [Candidatus Limivivens merdigallinarum]
MISFSFQRAEAVWAQERELEKNCELLFRAILPRIERGRLYLAASSIYRVFINGRFVAAGPARTAHGFYRVDCYEIGEYLTEPKNIVAIEVVGYGINSYDTLDQPSFLTAEIRSGDRVIAYTGEDGMRAYDLKRRIQRVQRYSFQRAFIDAYRLPGDSGNVYTDCRWEAEEERLCIQEEKRYLKREVRYPGYERLEAKEVMEQGTAEFAQEQPGLIGEETYFQVGELLLGYSYEEVERHVSEEAQRIVFTTGEKEKQQGGSQRIQNGYAIYQFPYNGTGFIDVELQAEQDSEVYLEFDEVLIDGKVDFLRMQSCNCFFYQLQTGEHRLLSFAPYTMQYLNVIVKGAGVIKKVSLIEYKHPPVKRKVLLPEDKELTRIYEAALESFRANSLDLFMDCPSRERGGWLCDSYFTAQVEAVLTGESVLEHAFLENFIINDQFEQIPKGMLPMCYPADHNNGNFIPNWAMWFVLELWNYTERTGKRDLAEQAQKTVEALADWFSDYENEYGLLENLDGWIFVEWSRANDADLVNGVNFPTNMLYMRMLREAGKLYGNPAWEEKADRLRNVIRSHSIKGQFYTDHEERVGMGVQNSGESTEVCQYYAFFTGTATVEEDAELWNTLLEEFGSARKKNNRYPRIAPTNAFIGSYLRIELLYRAGEYPKVIQNIKDYFLPMAEQTGTLWEHDKPTGSLNHGFASYVIYWLAGIYGTSENGQSESGEGS